MTSLYANGHHDFPRVPCKPRPAPGGALRGFSSRAAVFRGVSTSHSCCSVDTAEAIVTATSTAEHAGDTQHHSVAPPWQSLDPASALSSAAFSSRPLQHSASAAATAAAACSSRGSQQHMPSQQQQQLHSMQQSRGNSCLSNDAAAAAPSEVATSPTGTWHQQHIASVAQWRLLTDPGQDETSRIILSCSCTQQLLNMAHELLQNPVSKWHYARLAAMAAVLLAAPEPGGRLLTAGQHLGRPNGQPQLHLQQPMHLLQSGLPSMVLDAPCGNGNGSRAAAGVMHLAAQHRCQPQTQDQASPLQSHHHRQQQPLQEQKHQWHHQQQHDDLCVDDELASRALQALVCPCVDAAAPTLHLMRGRHLSEVLHAAWLLLQRNSSTQQPMQSHVRLLQQRLGSLQEPALLSAVHGCRFVHQLQAVVQLAAAHFSPIHVKAAFVQLARLQAGSQDGNSVARLLDQLLQLLPAHLPQLQPHHCASLLWSLGQLRGYLSTPPAGGKGSQLLSLQQQLLRGALANVSLLNARVCAQLLHGAARLQLQLPEVDMPTLQAHIQQQVQLCDPQAMSSMLWSLATLQRPGDRTPSHTWLHTFYNSSWKWLQPSAGISSSSTGTSGEAESAGRQHSCSSGHPLQPEPQPKQQWQSKSRCTSFEPVELAALLTAVCRLQLQPPSGWLAAVADCARQRIGAFQQQELAVMMWAFSKLQYAPPQGLMTAAAARAAQLGPCSFRPQSLALLLYAVARLQRWQLGLQSLPLQLGDYARDTSLGAFLSMSLQAPMQLQHWCAADLALLAWSLGVLQKQQQQQQSELQQQQLPALPAVGSQQQQQVLELHGACLTPVLQAATEKLLQQQFTPQGVSTLLWGLGTALHQPSTRQARHRAPQHKQEQEHWVHLPPEPAALSAFVEAAAAAATQHAALFSRHELSGAVWGMGALVRLLQVMKLPGPTGVAALRQHAGCSTTRQLPPAVTECLDLLACQLLDAAELLSQFQLAAAVQGLAWAKHPRGLDLLHVALVPTSTGSRLQEAQPQELLLLLRACIMYKYVPEGPAWASCIAAVQRVLPQLGSGELLQLLFLLGKLQTMSDRQQRQRAMQAAAAAAGPAGAWQSTNRQRQQQALLQEKQVQLKQLVPQVLLDRLLVHVSSCVDRCGSKDVSLMLWGVSHLQRQVSHQQRQEPQPGQTAAAQSSSSLCSSSSTPVAGAQVGPLLRKVHAYVLQHRRQFAPGNLATLLYAMHRLSARPQQAWLHTVATQFSPQELDSMDGQSLAVLALGLAGLNWVPPKAWLDAYVKTVTLADRQGRLVTTWQRRCISNGLAALNPLTGHTWLQ